MRHSITGAIERLRPSPLAILIALAFAICGCTGLIHAAYEPFRIRHQAQTAAGQHLAEAICLKIPGCGQVRLAAANIRIAGPLSGYATGWMLEVAIQPAAIRIDRDNSQIAVDPAHPQPLPAPGQIRQIVQQRLDTSGQAFFQQQAQRFVLRVLPAHTIQDAS